jgi:hypothetical protein
MQILLQEKEVAGLGKLPKGVVIQCLTGDLWVTCEGDNNDHILHVGHEYTVTDRGTIVVMAQSEARMSLSWPQGKGCSEALVPVLQN